MRDHDDDHSGSLFLGTVHGLDGLMHGAWTGRIDV
jgi:hypothetical protein